MYDHALEPVERQLPLLLSRLENVLHALEQLLIRRVQLSPNLCQVVFHLILVHLGKLPHEGDDLLAELSLRHTFYLIQTHLHQHIVKVMRILLLLQLFDDFLVPLVLLKFLLRETRQVFLLFLLSHPVETI